MAKKSKESPQDKLINLQAQQLAAQVANWAAQLEFQKERLRLLELPEMQGKAQIDIDRLAFEKAQASWENAFKESTLTGTYNGQPTTEWLTQQAQLTGVLNGQQTLQGKLTDAQVAQMNAQMKLANDQFVTSTTGYYNGQKTFDREKFEAGQAQDAWKFLATLTGPSNAFKQARAIGSMPGGLSDMMNAWAGKYALPGSTSVGSGGQASLAGLLEGAGPPVGNGTPSPIAVMPVAPGVPPTPGAPGAPPIGAPPAAAPTGPPEPAPVEIIHQIPGQGYPPSMWNANTQAAVAAWNAAHPGYIADGTPFGYHQGQPGETGVPIPPALPPSAPVPIHTPTPPGQFVPPPRIPAPAAPTANNVASYSYEGPGVQASANQWNYSANQDGSVAVYPPGVSSPAQTPDITSSQAMTPGAANALYQYGGGAQDPGNGSTTQPVTFDMMYDPNKYSTGTEDPGNGSTTQPVTPGMLPGRTITPAPAPYDPYNAGVSYSGPLLPNQINARNYNNTYEYGKELAWAGYEDQGWDKGLAQETYLRSLPKYSGPKAGSFAF